MSADLSRTQRLATVDRAIEIGERFLHDFHPHASTSKTWKEQHAGAAIWKAAALASVNALKSDPLWVAMFEAIDAEPTRMSIRQSVLELRMLRCRIEDRRPEGLDERAATKLRTSAMLVTFGDFIIDTAEPENNQGFNRDFLDAIATFEAALLPAALADCAAWAAEDGARNSSWMRSINIIRAHVDSDTKILQIDRPVQWRVGWALLTLGWQIADAAGDSISVGGPRLCTVDAAVKARAEFLKFRRVSCPHCGERTERLGDVDREREGGILSCLWRCEACAISVYFPYSARHESIWAESAAPPAERSQRSPPATSGRPLELAWMRDPALREIAEGDMREVDACIAVGAWKAALLLSGSACETMLLEVLERNARISASYMKKAEQFPDKTSLDDMIRAAEAEKLIKSLALTIAPALRAYRDLIHPNRARQATFTVSESSVLAIAHSVRVIAEELEAAHGDGRLAAFLSK